MRDLQRDSSGKQITKIVVTGGPCAGKTTALSWIQNAFTKMDYAVLFVDETATQLITGGAAPWLAASNRDYQWQLIQLQQANSYKELKRLEEIQYGHAEDLTAEDYTFLLTWDEEDQYADYQIRKIEEFKEEVAAWRRKARNLK